MAILTSSKPNLIPTQLRGPPPNGIQAKGSIAAFLSAVNLERKFAGDNISRSATMPFFLKVTSDHSLRP